MNTDFDLYDAQYDVQVAPPGVSKTEIARWHYEQFRSSPRIARNWTDEIATDAAENRKIILRRVGGDSVRGPCGLISRREKEPVCGK